MRSSRRSRRRRSPTATSTPRARSTPRRPMADGGQGAVDEPEGQPRAVQPRPPLRGGGCALPGNRQEDPARRCHEERGPYCPHLRAGGSPLSAGAPGNRNRPGEALSSHRGSASTSRWRSSSSTSAGTRPATPLLRRVRAGPQARGRPGRSGGALRTRRIHVHGHGRRGSAHRRCPVRPGPRPAVGRRRAAEAVPDRRHRRDRRVGRVRPGLRPAKFRVRRNVRVDCERALELPHVPAEAGRAVHGRVRTRGLQRDAVGPFAEGRHVLLSEPAALARSARAQPVVRVRLLPEQPAAVHAVDSEPRVCGVGRQGVREPVRAGTGAPRAAPPARSASNSRRATRGTATSGFASRPRGRTIHPGGEGAGLVNGPSGSGQPLPQPRAGPGARDAHA